MKKEDETKDELNEVGLDYQPFFKSLKEKGLNQNQLKEYYEISSATLNRMRHGKNMKLATAGHFMKILGIDDISKIVNVFIRRK